MKKFLILLGLLLLGCIGFIIYDTYSLPKIPVLEIEDKAIDMEQIYIYGTHLNMEGKLDLTGEVDLVLYNRNFLSYKIIIEDGKFSLSQYKNDGMHLDDIPVGRYYLFLRTKYTEEEQEKYKYYAINNNTEYQKMTYYTMSNYDKKITIENDDSYPTMMINVIKIKNKNVYDVVIDPGHGGIDSGATKYGYNESDFTMDIAVKLKERLNDYGLKVKLTHERGQLSNENKLPEYGNHGRAVIPYEVNAKYVFSIHLNSSSKPYVNGLEVYTASGINYDFSKLLVNNIKNKTGINYSINNINKIDDGIYSRNFTEDEIETTINNYIDKGLNPYDITTDTSYYYMIRETGGIITGAYVDNRNDEILGNPYTKSNIGAEAYLLELGYLSNIDDLNNVKDNMNNYVDAIADSIKTLYVTTS